MAVLGTPGRGETALRLGRPGGGRSVLAGAGGRTLGREHAPAVAILRTPGRGRSYLAVGTPRSQPVCVSQGGKGTCTPRPWPFCACRGVGEATRRLGRPVCNRTVLAAAGGRTLGRPHAPAVAVLRTPEQGRSHLAIGTLGPQSVYVRRGGREGGQGTCTPRQWPFYASLGGREDTG